MTHHLRFGTVSHLHGKHFPATVMRADEGALALMEGKNMILEVEMGGVGFQTSLLGALEDTTYAHVDMEFVFL